MSIKRRLPLCVTVMCLALSSFPHIAASLFPHKPTLTSPLCLSNTHTDPKAQTLKDQQINQTLERLLSSSAPHLFKWSRWLCVVTAEGFSHCHACWSRLTFLFYFFYFLLISIKCMPRFWSSNLLNWTAASMSSWGYSCFQETGGYLALNSHPVTERHDRNWGDHRCGRCNSLLWRNNKNTHKKRK